MNNNEYEKIALVHKHQLDSTSEKLGELSSHLNNIKESNSKQDTVISGLESEMKLLFDDLGLDIDGIDCSSEKEHNYISLTVQEDEKIKSSINISLTDTLSFNNDLPWDEYLNEVNSYITKNNIDITKDPFEKLLSIQQKIEIEKRIKDEFTFKKANCDKYDYMIAGTCGAIGGLIDAFFVGLPGVSVLGEFTDKQAGCLVEKFAEHSGWSKSKALDRGSNTTKSAIGFLEGRFKVNYDHRHGGDVGNTFRMSTTNHHLKSLAHSPSPVGLFFSILNQFTNTASFVNKGQIITVNTNSFALQGSNFISKIYAGFVNWIGHLFSDLAGASGSAGRGSGVPIPFYEVLQFAPVGSFGENRKNISNIAVNVFEQGYDARHGAAMAIPVIITELLIRIMWSLKSHFYHKKSWKNSLPFGNNPELRRMLLVGHGCLCLIDITDAAIRSGCEPVQMLLRMNLIAWVRFSHLGLKELLSLYRNNTVDTKLLYEHIDQEYERLLKTYS